MKKIPILFSILISCVLFAGFTGCSTLDKLGSFATDNQAVVDIAVRQAVFRYIDAGDSQAEKDRRATRVVEVVRQVDFYLEGEPTAGPDVLLAVVEANVRRDKLKPQDALLLRDVMTMIRSNIKKRQSEGLLDEDAVLVLRQITQTVISTAALL